jgi:hypothetical protein
MGAADGHGLAGLLAGGASGVALAVAWGQGAASGLLIAGVASLLTASVLGLYLMLIKDAPRLHAWLFFEEGPIAERTAGSGQALTGPIKTSGRFRGVLAALLSLGLATSFYTPPVGSVLLAATIALGFYYAVHAFRFRIDVEPGGLKVTWGLRPARLFAWDELCVIELPLPDFPADGAGHPRTELLVYSVLDGRRFLLGPHVDGFYRLRRELLRLLPADRFLNTLL